MSLLAGFSRRPQLRPQLWTDSGPHGSREGGSRGGLAVPRKIGGAVVRNRIKRRLREAWRELLPQVEPGRDYVVIARPGLAEAAESRGFDWLRERVAEALGKAAA